MTKNKTMMQLIHKAYACETKSMEQLTLALRSTTILVPRSGRRNGMKLVLRLLKWIFRKLPEDEYLEDQRQW